MTPEEMESVTYALGLLGVLCLYKTIKPRKVKKDADVIPLDERKRKALAAANRWPR